MSSANQPADHGQAHKSNLTTEQSSTYAPQTADRDLGANRPEEGVKGERLKERVDAMLRGGKKKEVGGGVKVGGEEEEEGDEHEAAAGRQP
ncbi:MAG: hypothetical protein Q9227_009248 [Pyrenula ochraceoflavens]